MRKYYLFPLLLIFTNCAQIGYSVQNNQQDAPVDAIEKLQEQQAIIVSKFFELQASCMAQEAIYNAKNTKNIPSQTKIKKQNGALSRCYSRVEKAKDDLIQIELTLNQLREDSSVKKIEKEF